MPEETAIEEFMRLAKDFGEAWYSDLGDGDPGDRKRDALLAFVFGGPGRKCPRCGTMKWSRAYDQQNGTFYSKDDPEYRPPYCDNCGWSADEEEDPR